MAMGNRGRREQGILAAPPEALNHPPPGADSGSASVRGVHGLQPSQQFLRIDVAAQHHAVVGNDGGRAVHAEIHAEVQATSPNYDNLARAIRMDAKLEVETL